MTRGTLSQEIQSLLHILAVGCETGRIGPEAPGLRRLVKQFLACQFTRQSSIRDTQWGSLGKAELREETISVC